ncbi:MAG: hypothetical protein A3C11_00440 [Candidatus Sungbacteria bacterium RIFCSPHIGHO2_02_FULL_49_12]|uniref:Uncharacterized protein n=1 Tax=Candidatus Sungbacteria bacterium RIFCSPHIGHO2_02_FULL_49_12 TaxID=1802271 RepID=A0A1G2KML8_9BACT|nr:MAG: hypothetical protein A3C11_00440 [Candidatus Sungbacteria bacterium RIFCSPHIGHO2_02_FULL_49_12]
MKGGGDMETDFRLGIFSSNQLDRSYGLLLEDLQSRRFKGPVDYLMHRGDQTSDQNLLALRLARPVPGEMAILYARFQRDERQGAAPTSFGLWCGRPAGLLPEHCRTLADFTSHLARQLAAWEGEWRRHFEERYRLYDPSRLEFSWTWKDPLRAYPFLIVCLHTA